MARFVQSVLVLMLLFSTACAQSGGAVRATPTPIVDDVSARFMANAPVAAQKTAIMPTVAAGSGTQGVAVSGAGAVVSDGIPLPAVNPLNLKGDLAIAGGSTLAPLTRAIYDRFVQEGYQGIIKIEEVGTTPGFKLYCETGETDMVMAARPIAPGELAACLQNGRTPVVFPVALNAVVVVVNPANSFVTDVTLDQLAAIFTAQSWSDVKPAWPTENIVRFVPDANFGTFSYFVATVLQQNAELLQKAPFTTLLSDETEVAWDIGDNPAAVGFLDYAVYQANATQLKALSIGGVKPTPDKVLNRSYPLVTELLLYTDPLTLQTKPQVASFLTFFLTYVNEEIGPLNDFPVSPMQFVRAKSNLLVVTGNEVYLQGLRNTQSLTPRATLTPTVAATQTISLTATPPLTLPPPQ
jgi:phosphate transport system substrate-binding protein